MRDQSPQPSSFVFPVALQPVEWTEEAPQTKGESWGWLEVFVLVQVLWGVLLFVPGSQAYRAYIRGFPYVVSLVAFLACLRSGATRSLGPGARLVVCSIVILMAGLVHPGSWLNSGAAQVAFQLSIAAPIFWAVAIWTPKQRLERLMGLVFVANFLSAGVGLLQVYYPETFSPPEFSSLGLRLNPGLIEQLTYRGSGDRLILRPPGLTDLPGGAAISGVIAALLGFAFAMRGNSRMLVKTCYLGTVLISITVVYLTQVRSVLLMLVVCMQALALVSLRQGRMIKGGWTAALGAGLIVGSFIWAVTLGGDALTERFQGMVDEGVVRTYQEHRGSFLFYTLHELVPLYPFGAGIGRWGMMSVYFGDLSNWRFPPLHAEIQVTGWLYDGGVLLVLVYGGAIVAALRNSYRVAISSHNPIHECGGMVFSVQVLIAGLCFTGPTFNNQLGILFWLLTAILFASQRTLYVQEEYAASLEIGDGERAEGQ
ncbi:MAG TPA: hypothetical protein VJM31_19790 [Vicinamibacterales bacterium]|nr:hypothetical protein [Vicinamibacterales bacterium]